uniref:Putative aminopeptidase P n=1 Tax=Paulinella chromatophora TaxID=39717 RepID=B1X3Z2_PAUCH|nr:putative aminopeptidase P [Paulinella chromatophora]ACB42661.1 putative aminopeptidase P [Paulinella chromatophora]|eukprot:gb/GEZN01008301.1/.p1 GENE.gb/GEZN01008301.1/~~gb/GEZN01008301.1/.p1  ORF type:complete len:441 (+),score=-14.62 gb/GEZN01008301.1/:26-1348(+)
MLPFSFSFFAQRRERFIKQLKGLAAIIPATSLVTHHSDVKYSFRQSSNFWYLTGFDEPGAVLLLLPYREGSRFVLFVEPKDPIAEVWHGFRWGCQGALEHFGADFAHPIAELQQRLKDYLKNAEGVAFQLGCHLDIEPLVLKAWKEQQDRLLVTGNTKSGIISPCPILHEMRMHKDNGELDRMRKAAWISAEAHEIARAFTQPGMTEHQIQAVIEQHFLMSGTQGPAYGTIVASGDNACVLHYTKNSALLRKGDLLLIDAGCSLNDYYNSDITRTFPIGGHFSSEQRIIYELVLGAQRQAIASIKPGKVAAEVHNIAIRVLVEGLIELGLLMGSVDGLIDQGAYRHLYMHRTSHWLGLDVHDVGSYQLGIQSVKLEPGYTLTVEPGIYISDRLQVPKGQPAIEERWKGIGIRIEDDIAVTFSGHEVLTSTALKDPLAMEC